MKRKTPHLKRERGFCVFSAVEVLGSTSKYLKQDADPIYYLSADISRKHDELDVKLIVGLEH